MKTTSLMTVDRREPGDSLVVCEREPGDSGAWRSMQTGNEPESLACGGCGAILFQGVSKRTTWEQFAVRKRLLMQCLCGVLNIVPAHPVACSDGLRTPGSGGLKLPGLGGADLIPMGKPH